MINTGFIWPIFMYALESDDEGGTWAVGKVETDQESDLPQ